MNKRDEEIEPLAVTIERASHISGESRSRLYELIASGELEAVKSGSKTLIIFESIQRRLASLPKARIKGRTRAMASPQKGG